MHTNKVEIKYFENKRHSKKSKHMKRRKLNKIRESVINHRHNVTFFYLRKIIRENLNFIVNNLSMIFFYYNIIF